LRSHHSGITRSVSQLNLSVASMPGGESSGGRADANGCVRQSRAECGRDVGPASLAGSRDGWIGEAAGVGCAYILNGLGGQLRAQRWRRRREGGSEDLLGGASIAPAPNMLRAGGVEEETKKHCDTSRCDSRVCGTHHHPQRDRGSFAELTLVWNTFFPNEILMKGSMSKECVRVTAWRVSPVQKGEGRM
jgi:hypothetical protein